VVSQEQQASWVRNFNPLTTAAAARWPTLAGIYEPLWVFNSVKSSYVPWLAVASAWRDDNRILSVTTRDSVLWSARATVHRAGRGSRWALKKHRALDRRGV
jgi:peptide/nickel transport system substrate-binding protein